MMTSTDPTDRRWLALALLCTVQFMVVLDVSIVNIARATFVRDLLSNFLAVAFGLGCTMVAATVAGTSGIANTEQGVASGLINTSQQLGNALGLAILVSIAAARTATVTSNSAFEALVSGFRWGYTAAVGFAFLGALIALIVVRDPENRPTVVLDGADAVCATG